MLQALEKFVAVKDYGDGSAFKVDGVRGIVIIVLILMLIIILIIIIRRCICRYCW